jgi:hypothetical protein
MRNFSLFLICAALLAIAGCGGGDDSSSTTTAAGVSGATGASGATPLSQDEFLTQANTICATLNKEIEALQAPTNDMQSIADFASQGLALVQPAFDQFSALQPPDELADQWEAYLADAQKQIDLDKQLLAAAQDNDAGAVNDTVKQLQRQSDSNNQLASQMGLTECAKNASPQG